MDARERELLTGMGNCYAACHEDYEGTVGMVAGSRGLSPEDVKSTLARMRQRYGEEPEFQRLRRRLPDSFPF